MTSLVWNYFIPKEDNKAECMLCHKMYSRKGRGTTCLRNHLRSMHMPQFGQLHEDELKKAAATFGEKRKIDIKTLIAKESYKLHHNNHLTLVLEALAGDEFFMDITLTAEGKAIKAHKSVLSAVSPYFQSVLKENPCQHPIIIMPRDICFEELNNIITYIYRGEMTIAAEDLPGLLRTAEILQVTGLSPEMAESTSGIPSDPPPTSPPGMFANASSTTSNNVSVSRMSVKKPRLIISQTEPRIQPLHHTEAQFQNTREGRSFNNNQPQSKGKTNFNKQGRGESPRSEFEASSPGEGINPVEYLNVDMSIVKEELPSDTEETQNTSSNLARDSAGSFSSVFVPPSTACDSPDSFQHYSNRHKSSFNLTEDPSSRLLYPCFPSLPCPPLPEAHVCPHCLETHRPNDLLRLHLRSKHPSKQSFMCACGRVFVRHLALVEHGKKCEL